MDHSVPRVDHPKKSAIKTAFERDPKYYHENAKVQRKSAERLIASLEPWTAIIPAGPVIEVGCGTGFLTTKLPSLFNERTINISDLSPAMVDFCRERMRMKEDEGSSLSFEVKDAEYLEVDQEQSLIIHNFVAQWFHQPVLSMERMIECLRPGGLMLCAFPGNQSFPEWKEATENAGVPYTGNRLPDTEEVVTKLSASPVQVDYYEDTITSAFESPIEFFSHLKKIGAATLEEDQAYLTPRQMRELLHSWKQKRENGIQVSYHVVFLAVKKD